MTGTTPCARTIAVTSGKGGVGKSCLTANLAWGLAQAGRRVLVLDADLGLANLDILLNLNPTATLHDVVAGTRGVRDVILEGPGGLHVLPAGSGMAEYSRLSSELRERLPAVLDELVRGYDYLFLDTGAGISDVVLYTASLAREVLVVATPEPTALADAYATIKVMALQHERTAFGLVINRVTKERLGPESANQLKRVADRFLRGHLGLAVSLEYWGAVPDDPAVERSVCLRRPVAASEPASPAARALRDLTRALDARPAAPRGVRPGSGAVPICSVTEHG